MEETFSKRKKARKASRDELLRLNKEELVEQIIQFKAHNVQLSNIIKRKDSASEKSYDLKRKREFDFTKCHYRRILLRLMYFGWDYQGYVVQEDTAKTIEHHLFQALTKACLIESREASQYNRCGRTDKGVSAFGQVISLTIRSKHPPEEQHKPEAISSEIPYCYILTRLLPNNIKAIAWMPIPADKPEFSARFDCKKRQYKYYFPRGTLNLAAMQEACACAVGVHDFRHLCKMDVGNGVTQYTREILRADILPVGEESGDPKAMYYLLVEGNAFLWHQIRCLMAILLLVGEGKEKPSIITELLDVEKNPRTPQYHMALDVPLNLFHCSYDLDESNWVYKENELRLTISDLQKEWTIHNIKTTMIKDCLQELEGMHTALCEKRTDDQTDVLEGDKIAEYTNGLIPGVKSRIYKPLMERPTCHSLEEKIEYQKRKRRYE